MFFCLIFRANEGFAASKVIDVVFLTHAGSSVLKSWSPEEVRQFLGKKSGSDVSPQKFLFEESAKNLPLNDRASIDLITITTGAIAGTGAGSTPEKTIRVPRFLVWRGYVQFKWDSKKEELSARVKRIDPGNLIVPASYFEVSNIRKIELSEHTMIYPQTKLRIRTNPAASRGEKLFTQSCLACHSTSTAGAKSLSALGLTSASLKSFATQHQRWKEMKLDARSERGLVAYSEALALEKAEDSKGKK